MSGYNNFTADTVGLRDERQRIRGIAETPAKLQENFDRTVDGTSEWNGQDDDFKKQTDPQDKQQIEMIRNVLGSMTEFLTGLDSAVGQSLGSIEGTSQEVKDQIHDAETNADTYGTGGHGKH